jgi:hypothetical protein
MAAGDPVTLTRAVTLNANGFVAGVVTNNLANPAYLMSIQSDNANILVVSCMVEGIPKRLVKVGVQVTVILLNQLGSQQSATITANLIEVDPKFASNAFPSL